MVEQLCSQTNHTAGNSTDVHYENWVITVSKDGYETYVGFSEIAKDIIVKVILQTTVKTKVSTKGNILVALNPELGSRAQLLEI